MKHLQYNYADIEDPYHGELRIIADDNEFTVEVEQEIGMLVGNSNTRIKCAVSLSLNDARAIAAWLSSVTK